MHTHTYTFHLIKMYILPFKPGFPDRGGQPMGKVQGENDLEVLYDQFPDDFVWASATSAYQVEGGWNSDGRFISYR